MDFWQEYKNKLRTPEQAVQKMKSGDRVDCSPGVIIAARKNHCAREKFIVAKKKQLYNKRGLETKACTS